MVTFSNHFLWRGWCLQNPYRIYTVMMQYVIATCQYVRIIRDIQVQIRKCSPAKMLIWPNKPLTSTDPLTSWAVRCVHRIRSAIWCKCGVFTFLHLTFSQFYVHGGICWRSVFFPVRLGSQVLCSIPMVGFTTWIQWRSTGIFDVFLAKHGGFHGFPVNSPTSSLLSKSHARWQRKGVDGQTVASHAGWDTTCHVQHLRNTGISPINNVYIGGVSHLVDGSYPQVYTYIYHISYYII